MASGTGRPRCTGHDGHGVAGPRFRPERRGAQEVTAPSAAAVAVAPEAIADATDALDEVSVVLEPGTSIDDFRASMDAAGTPYQRITDLGDGALSVQFATRTDLVGQASALAAFQGVVGADPELVMTIADAGPEVGATTAATTGTSSVAPTPNDEFWSSLWGLHESPTEQGVGVLDAWSRTMGSPATVVAVIDTGYIKHKDLKKNQLPGWDFLDNDDKPLDDQLCASTSSPPTLHGTHVAGTIAAQGNNKKGVIGVAPSAKFIPVRALGSCGSGSSTAIALGIKWAAGIPVPGAPVNPYPAKIINMSLGGAGSCPTLYQDAIDAVTALGEIVVVAAGNENADTAGFTPANCDHVITVASIQSDGTKSSFSNYGAEVDVAAPGSGILSTFRDTNKTGKAGKWPEGYSSLNGTSMATPHVAGVLALLASVDPTVTTDEALALLGQSVRSFPTACTGCGAGLLDAGDLLALVTPSPSIASPAANSTIYIGSKVVIGWEEVEGKKVTADLVTASGAVIKLGSSNPAKGAMVKKLSAKAPAGSATLRLTITSNTKPATTSTLEVPVTVAQPYVGVTTPSAVTVGEKVTATWLANGATKSTGKLIILQQNGTQTVLKQGVKLQKGKLKFVWPTGVTGPVNVTLVPDSSGTVSGVLPAIATAELNPVS
ncbi:MAG: S8 family serine peptidase [Ilumatobacteraceae bacterium]